MPDITDTNAKEGGQSHRLYCVELLRILFIAGIIVNHIIPISNELRNGLYALLDVKYVRLWYGVEFFFIMGGFFLYKTLKKDDLLPFESIKKLWWRLTPGLIFAFLILAVLGIKSWTRLPGLLFEMQGLSIIHHPMGGGDWFVGAYFWASALFIGLSWSTRRFFWVCLGVVMYLIFSLQFNGNPALYAATHGSRTSYYTFLGSGVARSISCMGLGIVCAYLSAQIKIRKRLVIRVCMTAVEVSTIYMAFKYSCRTSAVRYEMLDVKLAFCVFLISAAHSYGFISAVLNRMRWISIVSKYTYSFLLGHIVLLNIFLSHKYKGFGVPSLQQAIIIIGGGIVLGIIEYHLVERFLVSRIKNYLCQKKEAA